MLCYLISNRKHKRCHGALAKSRWSVAKEWFGEIKGDGNRFTPYLSGHSRGRRVKQLVIANAPALPRGFWRMEWMVAGWGMKTYPCAAISETGECGFLLE